MKRGLSIRQYTLLLYLVLALLPILANSILFRSTYTTARESAQYWQKTLVESLAREINDHLDRANAQLIKVQNMEQQYGRNAALEAMYRITHISKEDFHALYLTDSKGYIIAADFSRASGGLASNFIGMRLTGISSDTRQQAQWTRFFLSVQSKVPTVRLVIPSGDIMVVGDFNLKSLKDRFDQLEIPPGSHLFLVDEQGEAIFPSLDANRASPANPLVQAALQNKRVLFGYDSKNDMTGAIASLDINNWYVCFEQPRKYVFELHNQFLLRSSIILFIGFCLLLITLILLHSRVIRPLGWIIARSKTIPHKKILDTGRMPRAAIDLEELWLTLRSSVRKLERREQHLITAQHKAEAANHAKSTFLAKMSHELRTPLNGILGYTQHLKKDNTLDSEQQGAIATINECGEHLLLVINDILDLSKVEAGKMELAPACLRLETFLQEIAGIFRYQATGKQMAFHFYSDPLLPAIIETDALRLRQVLFNLLGNAVKFSNHGEIRFSVDSDKPKAGKTILHFNVEDTGPGISPEQQQQVFKPFIQADEGLSSAQGTGLGLSISHELVKLMGGDLQLISPVPDRLTNQDGESGSRFYFSIEVKINYDTMIRQAEKVKEKPGQACPMFQIEDLDKIPVPPQKLLRELLTATGDGDIEEVEGLITTIAQTEQGKYKTVAAAMQQMASSFRFADMEKTLKLLIENHRNPTQPS